MDINNSNMSEAGPSGLAQISHIRYQQNASVSPSGRRRLRKLSLVTSPTIPLNDDSDELIEGTVNVSGKETSVNNTAPTEEVEQELSISEKMTYEEMKGHVSTCLQLSTENKITVKNAFALKLIDCMSIIAKNADENNFAAMACQLDAGAKIYSHRVDAVHQQAVKLMETYLIAMNQNKKYNERSEEEDDGGQSDRLREKKKKTRKNLIATKDQICRRLKGKDPKDKLVRLEALPGDILSKAKHDSYNLSVSLDRHIPFWPNSENYKPLFSMGLVELTSNELPFLGILRKRLIQSGHVPFTKSKLCLTTEGIKVQAADAQPSSSQGTNVSTGYQSVSPDPLPSGSSHSPELLFNSGSDGIVEAGGNNDIDLSIHPNNDDSGSSSDEVEIISLVKKRMKMEGSTSPSRADVIRAVFHQPGESEYHYLKMDSANYWAGPSYWKRPLGPTQAEKKRRTVRKRKMPREIKYDIPGKSLLPEGIIKKSTTLSARTLASWRKKKTTFPEDIQFDPDLFETLFLTNIFAETLAQEHKSANESRADSDVSDLGMDEQYSDDVDKNSGEKDYVQSTNELLGNAIEGGCSPVFNLNDGFKGFASPGQSSGSGEEFRGFSVCNEDFKGFELGSSESNEPEVGPSGSSMEKVENPPLLGTQSSQASSITLTQSSQASSITLNIPHTQNQDDSSGSCDVYEGENLVPMVKRVKVEPIRVVARPNRVDIHHLKDVMFRIIQRRTFDNTENHQSNKEASRPQGSVMWRDVLTELFNTDELHYRTRQDLSVSMAFLSLLTLTNEYGFNLQKDNNMDIVISYTPENNVQGNSNFQLKSTM